MCLDMYDFLIYRTKMKFICFFYYFNQTFQTCDQIEIFDSVYISIPPDLIERKHSDYFIVIYKVRLAKLNRISETRPTYFLSET